MSRGLPCWEIGVMSQEQEADLSAGWCRPCYHMPTSQECPPQRGGWDKGAQFCHGLTPRIPVTSRTGLTD